MDYSKLSISEVQAHLDAARRKEQMRNWSITGALMVVATILCFMLAPTTEITLAVLLPVLGLIAVGGAGIAELTRKV